MRQQDVQAMADKAMADIAALRPKVHIWIFFLDGEVGEYEAEQIKVGTSVIEIHDGGDIRAFPLANIKSYTINEP